MSSTATKKKYKPRDNQSMSIMSLNSSILDQSTISIPPEPKPIEIYNLESYIDPDQHETHKTYKFEYNFNQYLRMFMVKLLPLREDDMTILIEEKTLRGPEAKCEKFLKKVKTEFDQFIAKIVKYHQDTDIEEIEFKLEKKYQLKIFKPKFLKLITKDITDRYHTFRDAGSQFLRKIDSQQNFLLRVEKKYETNCLQQIGELMQPHLNTTRSSLKLEKQKPAKSRSSSEDEIVEDEDEPSFYQSQRINLKDSNSSHRQYSHANFKKMEEPTEEDSVSVVEEKRRQQRNKDVREKGEEKKMRIIKEYQFQSEFDEKAFQSWLKGSRNLTSKNVKVILKEDPYDSEIHTYIVQLLLQEGGQRHEAELIEALQVYLKFRKVVMIKLVNDKYRDQLVQKYERSEQLLTIKYVKGYKSPKWTEAQMWKHVIRQDYSDVKKTANNEYFQLFFLQGLKNLVIEMEKEIRDSLATEPKDDLIEELIVKLPSLADHLRSHQKLKDLVKEYVIKLVADNYKHCCQVVGVDFPISAIKVTLRVKMEQQEQYQKNVKGYIFEKIQKEIKVSQYTASSQIDKLTYDRLEKVVIITHKDIKSFKFITTIYQIEEFMKKINEIFQSQNNLTQMEINFDDEIVGKKLNDQLSEIIKDNKQLAEVKPTYSPEQSKIKLYGKPHLLEMFIKLLEDFKAQIQQKRVNYFQLIKKKEGELLEKNAIFKNIEDQYDITVKVNKIVMPAKIILSNAAETYKKKNILIVKSKNLDYAPCGSTIAFRSLPEVQLFKGTHFLKTFKNYINKHKTELFTENSRRYTIMLKLNHSVVDTLKEALAVHPNPANHIIMIMPETGKEAFVKAIIKELLENKQHQAREITIMIIEFGLSADIQGLLNISPYVKGKKMQLKDEKITKYYVEDKANKYYYSDNGNRKILAAKEQQCSKVILNNEDLNIGHISHSFYTQGLILVHLQSHNQFPVKYVNNRLQFVLKNQTYEIPQDQATIIINAINSNLQKVDVSLGVYEIDLTAMKQVNLFSDYQRNLCKQEVIIKAEMNQEQAQAFYNVQVAQIKYSYYFDDIVMDNFDTARQQISAFLESHAMQKTISYKQLKNIEVADIEGMKTFLEDDQSTQFSFNHINRTITLKSLDETNINRSEQFINILLTNVNEKDSHKIKYPSEWEPQKEDIETFQVNKNTQEFAKVQALFTVGQIKSLIRIQNRIIYKKYSEESIFLESVNGKKVKTMQLFHGTRTTNPEEIYKDKEESFNINYSSDNNLLGKGIYFAERSEYSNDYRYNEVVASGNIFGLGSRNIHSMFLCDVLVGESQKCQQHNGAIKDTGFKDPVKKIKYESMTDFLNNSNIFVVYKSRRAYPLYLIKY